MMSLFAAQEEENRQSVMPLAARMRPRTLDEFAGQQHFLGEGKLLRRLIKADRLSAVIFFGPPGTGKTTLAHLLASSTQQRFRQLNAVSSGVKELREVL
ncbi:MAG: AAA family ATPase, partial [Lacipirellulaceae bacterium]